MNEIRRADSRGRIVLNLEAAGERFLVTGDEDEGFQVRPIAQVVGRLE